MLVHHIDAEAHIGAGTVIGPYVFIGPRVWIGENCVIDAGVKIGLPGFGYNRDPETGRWERKPTQECEGKVIIGDDVHIGANTCIDGGSYRPTYIQRGARIDNLCHIAHNVQIGENAMIVACSMLAGSVVIEDGAYVAPAAAIRDHITVGEDAFVGLGAVVVRNVKPERTVKGVPAR